MVAMSASPSLLNAGLDGLIHSQTRAQLFSGRICHSQSSDLPHMHVVYKTLPGFESVSPRRIDITRYLLKSQGTGYGGRFVAAAKRVDDAAAGTPAGSFVEKPEIDSLIAAIIHQAEAEGNLSQAFQKLSFEDWSKVLANVGKKHWELALAVFGIFKETSAFLKPKAMVNKTDDDELPVNILKVYTTMVAVLSKHGRLEEGESLLTEVQQLGFGSDIYLYNALLTGYAKKGTPERLLDSMLEMQKFGIQPNNVSYEQLVAAYLNMKTPELKMALEVVDHMHNSNIKPSYKTYSDLITVCSERGEIESADKCFTAMISAGHAAQGKLYLRLMQLHAEKGNHVRTEEVFLMLRQAGLKANATCYEQMLLAYCKSGCLNQAFSVFRESKQMLKPSLIVYNTLLEACAKAGLHFQAMQLFNEVRGSGLKANTATYTAAITALVRSGKCSKAEEIYRRMLRLNIPPTAQTYTAMIHAYTIKGWIRTGHEVCVAMKSNCKLTSGSYSAMLHLYLRGSWYTEAANVLGEMDAEGVEPGASAYGALIAACGDSSAEILPLARSLETSRWETCRVVQQLMFLPLYESCESLLEGGIADLPSELLSFLQQMAQTRDGDFNLCLYNSLMDALWRKGLKRRAKSVMLAARSLLPWYKRPKFADMKLLLDLRGLSLGASQVAVLDWLNGVAQNGSTRNGYKMVLVTGTSKKLQNVDKSPLNTPAGIKKAVEATLSELGSPFVETPHGSGKLVASVHDVVNWQAMYGISSALMLLDCNQPYITQ